VNASIGTIFSIYKRVSPLGEPCTKEDFLQPGNQLMAAGYVIYGSSTMLVYATRLGVNGFTLEPSIGEFCLSHPNMEVPENANVYSINQGNAVYFNDDIASNLKAYLEFREKMVAKRKIEPKDQKALFLSLQGKRISVRAVELMVKKYAKIAAPLKNITPHKLRSTYGTALYRATQDIYVVAEVLGHKDINTTKKHYAAISEDIKKSAANKVKFNKE